MFVDRLMGYPATQQHLDAVIGYHGNTCHPDALLLYSTSIHSGVLAGGERGGAVARPPFFLACPIIFSLSENFLSWTVQGKVVTEFILNRNFFTPI